MELISQLKKAKEASLKLLSLKNSDRNKAILAIADQLLIDQDIILGANQKDLEEAEKNQLSEALKDRLALTPERLKQISDATKEVAKQEDIVGSIIESSTREDGLIIQKQRIPLGVIGMIFESRPNVVVDCSALAIKSGNAIVLKGGKEATHSNRALFDSITKATSPLLPEASILLIEAREDVAELLQAKDYVDVVIPRGGETLIQYVYDNAKMPVIAHFKGNCHLYIDKEANREWVEPILLNAKMQRTGVCNAVESIVVHKDFDKGILANSLARLDELGCELRVDEKLLEIAPATSKKATEEDYATEFLDAIVSVKQVDSLEEAIAHINKYGSHHTEAIITENQQNAEAFSLGVDASCIMHNASTRFNDGGQLGLGAELGISTTKFHSYGPMGAKEMTCTRFLVKGNGHIRK
jgi:glutamate-5-semialdehyde dehydrogenase